MKIRFDTFKEFIEDAHKFKQEIMDICTKYGLDHNELDLRYDARLRKTAGSIRIDFRKKAITIKLSFPTRIAYGYENMLCVVRHEMAHWIDYVKNNNLNKKLGHGEAFKKICVELGGTMNSKSAGQDYSEYATSNFVSVPYKWKYVCNCGACNHQTKRRLGARKLNGKCRKCGQLVKDMEIKL